MDENEIDSSQDPLGGGPYDVTHLSDVIEVIKETDPDFTESRRGTARTLQTPSPMLKNGGGQVPMPPQIHHHPSGAAHHRRHPAEVKILEQPASKALRFRYECEGRSAGSIPGASSTPEVKTFPEIQVLGYQGRAVVVVSCVTKDEPYLVHPHNLVGKDGCKNGVCTLIISPDTMKVQFQNLGIQCVKKRDIESSLRQREQIRVDPFRQGYAHRNQPTSIDLNAVRLCFQVFLEGEKDGKFTVPLKPVVSDVIYDKKAMSDLTIIKLSDCVSYVDGGRKDIILLCEKVAKEDIEVHFYEEDAQKNRVWHARADFQPSQVHKQHAIWFRTPRYRTLDVTEPVKVFIQLYRPSDRVASDPLPFELLPLDSVTFSETQNKRKRAKLDQSRDKILGGLTAQDTCRYDNISDGGKERVMQEVLGAQLLEPIKTEPRDSTSPCGGYLYGGNMYQQGSPNYVPTPSISPQYMDLTPTPSPETINYPYRMQPVNIGDFNHITSIKPDPTWNMTPDHQGPSCSPWNIANLHQSAVPEQPPQLLDLDNHQINSGDLQNQLNEMNIPAMGQLPEFNSLSLTEIELNPQNMSDSLTNIVNEAADKNLVG